MRSREWNRLLAGLLAVPIPFVAQAETFLSESQAAAILFPGLKLEPNWMELTSAEAKQVEKSSRECVRKPRLHVFWGPGKEAVIIDEVVGKHEFITYAVAIQPNGKVKGIEIIEYKETYGYQVRD